MNKSLIKGVLVTAVGVLVAGLAMHYGKGSVPLLKDAHDGYDGVG